MDLVKRHLWLVVTIAAMLVLSGVALGYLHMQNQTREAREKVLAGSERLAKQISPVQPAMIEPLVKANEELQQDLEQIRQYLAQHSWSLVMEGRPTWFAFQGRYRAALNGLIRAMGGARLAATDLPAVVEGQPVNATMLVGPQAFLTPAVQLIEVAVAPGDTAALQQMQAAQEDLWLMEDLARAITATNQFHFRQAGIESPKISDAVIKELLQIEIGAQFAQPRRSRSASAPQGQRYLATSRPTGTGMGGMGGMPGMGGMGGMTSMPGGSQEVGREVQALTVTGHASNNNEGKYRVLPFRLTVLADAGNYLELVRQLPFNRSFITVLNVSYTVIPDTEAELKKYNLTATTLAEREALYGTRPLVILEIVGESLIFVDPAVRPVLGVAAPAAPITTGAR